MHFINEAFMCNVHRSDLTENEIQRLHSVLKTQIFQCRGMIYSLVLCAAVYFYLFWEETSLLPFFFFKKKRVHIPNEVPNYDEVRCFVGLLTLGINYVGGHCTV